MTAVGLFVGGYLVCSPRMYLQICDSPKEKKMVSFCSAGRWERFYQSDFPHLSLASPQIWYKAAKDQ
jgi:hypothetical protein